MTAEQQLEAKLRALSAALQINPTNPSYNAQLGGTNQTPVSSDKVLKDAETIFQWIIK